MLPAQGLGDKAKKYNWRKVRRLFLGSKKRLVRNSLLLAHITLLVLIGVFVVKYSNDRQANAQKASLAGRSNTAARALDQLSSADVAVHIALSARLEEAVAVANNADSANASLLTGLSDDKIVAKPQIVNTALKSKNDISKYVTVAGDSVASVAQKFGITSESIRWSNSLSGNNLDVGRELVISPVNGIVYKVKDGDNIDSIAGRFRANRDELIAFNDAEITGGFVKDELIVVPNGTIAPPAAARPAATTGFAFGNKAIFGYNGYDFGYCTWWSATRRAQMGRPIPANWGHARSWRDRAAASGYRTGGAPAPGAVIWSPPRGLGHVGIVEEVREDGSIKISEMNTRGWNVLSYKELNPEQARKYQYIY